ncbi:MAG TPA: patatin-like phospholipase family protein, partial [bacterium]
MPTKEEKGNRPFADDGRPKFGLALGGGGARGFAHLGVLKVLDDHGLRVDVIAGTSMGALAGALYAQAGSAEAAISRLQQGLRRQERSARLMKLYQPNRKGDHFLNYVAQRLQQRIIINLSINRKALLSGSRLEGAVAELLDDVQIEGLPIILGVVASDLVSGRGVIIKKGSLRRAVVASSSIPGFFPPVKWGNHLLVDGEVTDFVPVDACRALGADYVLAVDVTPDVQPDPSLNNTLEIFLRSVRITNFGQAQAALRRADFALRPVLTSVQWSDFDRLPELIALGESCAKSHIAQILR